MTADLDKLDALPVGAYVASALMAANIPCDSGEDVDRFLDELAKRGYLVAAARERDELRAAAEVVNSAFAVGWPDGGWQMTPKRITALNALEDALRRKDGAS